tara:strand:- start:1640 stop:2590 length:951 start_codon:yes stop_codon:yes gene_type:complete
MAERLELKPGIYRNGKLIARNRDRSNYTAQPGDIEVKSGSFGRNPVIRRFNGSKWPASPTRLTNAKDVPDSLRSHTQQVTSTGSGRAKEIIKTPLDKQVGGLSFAESLRISPGASQSTLKIGKKKSTKKPIEYSPSGDLIPSETDKAAKWNQGAANIYDKRKKTEAELVARVNVARSMLNNSRLHLTNSTEGKDNQTKAVAAAQVFVDKSQEELDASRGGDWEPTTVFTRHYKTGEALGVMTKRQRAAYEKEALGEDGKLRTFEGEMEKAGLAKNDPRRETKYTSAAWQRRQLQIAEAERLKDEKDSKKDLLIEPA